MMDKERRVIVWAGFVDGHLDFNPVKDAYEADSTMRPALYRTRAEARKRYFDVRRIVIDEHDAVSA